MTLTKKIKVGLPCSPITLLDSAEIEAEEIRVSFGGGMGGANLRHYALDVDMESDENFCIITTIEGRKIEVGKRFIVTCEPVLLQYKKYDMTKWRNYHRQECTSHIEEIYYVQRANEKIVFVNSVLSGADPDCIVYRVAQVTGEK